LKIALLPARVYFFGNAFAKMRYTLGSEIFNCSAISLHFSPCARSVLVAEPHLRARDESAFGEYCRKTPRWVRLW
jgi:hypothetical protein